MVTAIVIIVAFIFVSLALVSIVKGFKNLSKGNSDSVEITNLNKKYKKLTNLAKSVLMNKPKKKVKTILELEDEISHHKVYYLTFKGDIMAKAVDQLSEEITVLLNIAKDGDEVVLNLESPGGVVHGYGLAAAQLDRIKKAKLKLTICVDKVAASGGYMMACVGDEIVAAPFAILGSIGVVMEYPNFYELLNKVGVKYQQLTAGQYKRTISPFLEPSKEGTEKAKDDLSRTHKLFKDHITAHRKNVDIEKVATGETWYGSECIANGLIDSINTSDEVIQGKMSRNTVFKIKYKEPKKPIKLISHLVSSVLSDSIDLVLNKIVDNHYSK
jgi:serine protease SohB